MSRVENQRRLFLELIDELRPWWRRDPGLPNRLNAWLVRHRAGSRDRRLYRELAYTAWRILPWIEDAAPDHLVASVARHAEHTAATTAFIDAFALPAVAPDPDPVNLLPAWLADECPTALDPVHAAALLRRAPLWIRLQTDRPALVAAEFDRLDIGHTPSEHLPTAWRLERAARLTETAAFQSGRIEIQDIGSQALLAALAARPVGHWLDACAGAGGKSLQLATAMGIAGRVTAHDIRGTALQELELRATRAGLTNIVIERVPQGQFDGVLVDAPCSGSGTWRRSPHLKWTTSSATIAEAAEKQRFVLDRFARHVRHGGTLVYATCSLCRSENEAVVTSFLQSHPEFVPLPLRHPLTGARLTTGQLTLLPADLDSDGYFVASFHRN